MKRENINLTKISFFLLLLILTGCSTQEPDQQIMVLPVEVHLQDDGSKWKVNLATDQGIAKMHEIINEFQKVSSNSKEGYQKLGEDLYATFQAIFNACDMEGKGHDELHNLLTPMMGPMQRLKSCSSIEEGDNDLAAFKLQADAYSTYFYY